MQNLTSVNPLLLLAVPVLVVLVITRQLQARRMRAANLAAVPALLAFGLTQQAASFVALTPAGWASFAVSLVAGAILGAARAASIRTWTAPDGSTWMQGTRVTLVLWAILIAIRVVMAVASHFAGVSLSASAGESIAMLAVTFAVQNALLYFRSTAEPAAA